MSFVDELGSKIAASKAANGGNFIKDGRGVLVIKKLAIEKLYKGATFIGELQVVESHPSGEKDSSGAPIESNPVGSSVSFIQMLDANPDVAFGNTKAFLLAAAEEEESGITQEQFKTFLNDAVGSKQALRGKLVAYETRRQIAKKSGKTLTLPVFRPVPQTAEDIASRRAALEAQPV